MLHAVVEGFEHVYIIVDALDECPKSGGERAKLLNIIHKVYGWKMDLVHLLTTSREEEDIRTSLAEIPPDLGCFKSIEVQGIHVQRDIEKYLRHRLHDGLFKRWKPALKEDVKVKLASQADGMYALSHHPQFPISINMMIGSV
jgi:hypothetical protein